MRLRLTAPARRELMRAALWYDRERRGLGDEFLDDVVRSYEQLKQFPNAQPELTGGYRKLLLGRFPFAVI